MGKSSDNKRKFIMLPSALLYALPDTALRIILYMKHRQGLVDIGLLDKWELTLENICDEFKHHHGYSKNTVRNGIRELRKLKLIDLRYDHYRLNEKEFDSWYFKDIQGAVGLPKSGRGGLPKSGKPPLPKSGSQYQSSKEKKNSRAEKAVATTPVAPTQPPANFKYSEAEFEKFFPESKGIQTPRPKTPAELFQDIFPGQVARATPPDEIPAVSEIEVEPAQTTPETDTEER
jgi:hypothetical protein